jgi:hypothetical protein
MATILGLSRYVNKTIPTVFYGMYNASDYAAIRAHRGPAIVYWGGTDIIRQRKRRWLFHPNIKHVVQTQRNMLELKAIGLNSIVRPVMNTDKKYLHLNNLGDSVFCYVPHGRKKFYGISMIRKVAMHLPDTNFIIVRWGRNRNKPFKNSEIYGKVGFNLLIQLYNRSLCSIRPVSHDGLSQTVCELGMMGRLTAMNRGESFTAHAKNVNDYVEFVLREKRRNKMPHSSIRKAIVNTVNNTDWLYF